MLRQMSSLTRVLYTEPPDFCRPSMNAPIQAAPAAESSLSGDIVREVAALAAARSARPGSRRTWLFLFRSSPPEAAEAT